MSETMLFSFDPPIVFERIYTFDNPNFIFCWYVEDSNPEIIKSNNYRTKKILVKDLYAVFYPKDSMYTITLFGSSGSKDGFFVSVSEFPNLLKRFDLL